MALQGDPLGPVLLFWGKNTRREKALREEEEDPWAHTEDPSAEAQQERKKKSLAPPLPKQEVSAAVPNSPQEKLSRAALAAQGLFPAHTAEVPAGVTNGPRAPLVAPRGAQVPCDQVTNSSCHGKVLTYARPTFLPLNELQPRAPR